MKTTLTGLGVFFQSLLILCVVEAKASDQSFALLCPPNVTINCTDDVSDLDKWGKAYVLKNYQKTPAPAPKTTIYNTNACGIGTVTRTWEVEDPYWHLHQCSQTITIIGSTLFSSADILWPPAYTIEGCNPSTEPKNLPSPYNYPQLNRLKCSQAMYTYKDYKFNVSDGCMKILREWKVIDWCQYKPNVYPPVGQWSYTQVLKLIVNDSTATLTCPRDTVVESKLDCKGSFVKLDTARAFSKCGTALAIRNTSPYSNSKGIDASGTYPLGTTEFYFIAEYGCGKEIKCKVKVSVVNKIGPVPYCLNGLITALMPVDTNRDGTPDDGMVVIWAKDFNLGSFHPCGNKQLKYSFSKDTSYMSRVFTCADLGKNEIEMWVTDSLGNQSFCKTYLEVQNNNANIPDCKRKDSITSTVVLSGIVFDPSGKECPGVLAELTGNQSFKIITSQDTTIKVRYDTFKAPSGTIFYLRFYDTTFLVKRDTVFSTWNEISKTDGSGKYRFSGLKTSQSYALNLTMREADMDGITVNDAIVLLKHLLGMDRISDPYKLIAADINADKVIDQLDFDLLFALIQGTKKYEELYYHWRFIRKPFLFTNTQNPFLDAFDEKTLIPDLRSSVTGLNYTAVKIGELDGISGFTSGSTMARSGRSDQPEPFQLIRVFPNPIVENDLNFLIGVPNTSRFTLSLNTMQGQLLFEEQRSFDKGEHNWNIDLSGISATGVLFYKISDGNASKFGKLMISK